MTDRQLRYAMAAAGKVCRKHNPPAPYRRDDLFQEIMVGLIRLCNEKGDDMPLAWMAKKSDFLAITAIKAWRWGKESPLSKTEPPYSYDTELDPRVYFEEYGVYSDEIMEHLLPRQRAWVKMILEGYTHQEIANVYGIHCSNVGQTLRYAATKLKEAGFEALA